MRGLPFDRKVEVLLEGRSDVVPIVRPMLVAWRQLRVQIAAFDNAIRAMVRMSGASRLLMSVPGVGLLSALASVSTVEGPSRFARSRSVGVHLGLTPRQYQSGRGRSKRPDIQMWRHPDSNADVRGCRVYPGSVGDRGRCGHAAFSGDPATPRDPLRRTMNHYPTAAAVVNDGHLIDA